MPALEKLEITDFIQRQLALWPEAAARFEALSHVETKTVGGYRVQFNPARAVSTAAKVDAASIAARQCFLCAHNRPTQQLAIDWEDLQILVNPFPIFPGHLTIPAKQHIPQSMLGRTDQMRRLSRALPGYSIFFNGAKCGASAPDHFHFQAVPCQYLRTPKRFCSYELAPAEFSAEEVDPMVNMVCTDGVITVIPRTKHRPDCYGDLLISPAAIDLCGTLISVRRQDFDCLDAARVDSILKEVTFPVPPVYVGLIANNPVVSKAGPLWQVEGIVIGKDFHWEQRQTQLFAGQMLRHDAALFNRLDIEDYLRSVISSEMSASSSLELLKAHAIISRSWLFCQMRASRHLADHGSPCLDVPLEPGEIRQWFDGNEHTGFDVCSDDHCQRYQGQGRITSPNVDAAIEATRGLVLTYRGRICDARFSKCCGGRLEEFATCWQPRIMPYLIGVDDPFCSNVAPQVLAQVLNGFDRDTTPDYFSWSVSYSQTELSELVKRRSGIDFGTITDLIPLTRGVSGRISRLKIVGSKQSRIIGKELLIRRWLSQSHLYSSNFTVERSGSHFILHGCGWGHGVGLCQIGAANMAAHGYDFRQILAHYYPNAKISQFSCIAQKNNVTLHSL